MNWLAFDPRAYGAALAGCLLAILLASVAPPLAGSPPWLTGLLGGLACAAAARDRSGLRGLVVGVMATWIAAIDAASRRDLPLAESLLALHATLAPIDVAAYTLGLASACLLARSSLRSGAAARPAGV